MGEVLAWTGQHAGTKARRRPVNLPEGVTALPRREREPKHCYSQELALLVAIYAALDDEQRANARWVLSAMKWGGDACAEQALITLGEQAEYTPAGRPSR